MKFLHDSGCNEEVTAVMTLRPWQTFSFSFGGSNT